MWNLFGGGNTRKRNEGPKNAILMLRQQQEMLEKRESHLKNQIAEQDAVARKNLATNKTASKAALRRKLVHERTLQQTNDQILQIQQQVVSIEAATINQETFNAMKTAGKAMKEIHGNLSIDKVDATMDELREQHALGEEIANAISNAPIGDPVDEDELEAELEDMEQQNLEGQMVNTGKLKVNDLPVVAHGSIHGKDAVPNDEDEELRQLQLEMNM